MGYGLAWCPCLPDADWCLRPPGVMCVRGQRFGRYISSVPDSGEVEARTEAMGVRELWQPMLKEGGIIQFRSADKRYLSAQ